MRYRVTAPLVLAKDREGHVHHRYEGQLIPWLSDEQRDHLLDSEMIEPFDEPVPPGVMPADAPAAAAQPAPADPAASEVPDRPNQVATKDIWVDYAVRALGVDPAEAEAMTKNDLIALPAQ